MTATSAKISRANNGSTLSFNELSAMIKDRAEDELLDLTNQREQLRTQIAAIDRRKAEIRGVLRAMGVEAPEKKKERKRRSFKREVSTGHGVSIPFAEQIAKLLREYAKTHDVITVRDFYQLYQKEIDRKTDQVYNAFAYLRQIEFLGRAGRVGMRDAFIILDDEAIDRVVKEMQQQQEERLNA